jgi:hypothetical protein
VQYLSNVMTKFGLENEQRLWAHGWALDSNSDAVVDTSASDGRLRPHSRFFIDTTS